MKKIYFILIIFLPVITTAQITITQNDLPAIGWGYINAVDTNYTAAIPSGGTNQAWNYASLLNNYQDSLLFISPAGTPYTGQFPNANLATYNPNDTSYGYFISNSTGFYLNGGSLSQYNNLVAVYNPPQIFIPVPFTYNSTYSGFYRFEIDTVFNGDSAKVILHTDVTILGDGYGSLTLPSLYAPNTLRLKKTSLESDSIWTKLPFIGWTLISNNHWQTTEFLWLQNGGGTLLLDINADSLGLNATRSSYQILFVTVGIDENNKSVVESAYPNPSSDKVTFTFENNINSFAQLTIVNQIGQSVESYNVSRLNSFTITTAKLPNGMYSYFVQNEKGIKTKGKFIVVH